MKYSCTVHKSYSRTGVESPWCSPWTVHFSPMNVKWPIFSSWTFMDNMFLNCSWKFNDVMVWLWRWKSMKYSMNSSWESMNVKWPIMILPIFSSWKIHGQFLNNSSNYVHEMFMKVLFPDIKCTSYLLLAVCGSQDQCRKPVRWVKCYTNNQSINCYLWLFEHQPHA